MLPRSGTSRDGSVIFTELPLPGRRQGKVRDLYDLPPAPGRPPCLLVVATDRISAFDVVMPTPIPGKGRLLTRISLEWFRFLRGLKIVEDHLLSADPHSVAGLSVTDHDMLVGRSMVCRKVAIIPIECVVRGWLAGSGWQEYRSCGAVCGVPLPAGLRHFDRLPEPIFTPAIKADQGHDENCTFDVMAAGVGRGLAETLRAKSLEVYARGAAHAAARGIVLADTKFEWGRLPDGALILVDEVLTPDSSRFWPAADAGHGRVPDSFDKQFVRDWLEASGWDKSSPPPALPADVVAKTRDKYLEACRLLTGSLPAGVV